MERLLIKMPMYEGRYTDLEVIARLIAKHKLEYDTITHPIMDVYSVDVDELVFKSAGEVEIYVYGKKESIKAFYDELIKWAKSEG